MKKLFKKFAAIGMAAMMIMAMGVTAFAAAPGTYAVNLYAPSGIQMTHMSPIVGADLEDQGDSVKLTIYTQEITVDPITGYLSALSIENNEGIEVEWDENGQPTAFEYEFADVAGEPAISADEMLDITYTVEFVNAGGMHQQSTGSIMLVDRTE